MAADVRGGGGEVESVKAKVNVLLCVSGSVAVVKVPELAVKLTKRCNVTLVMSSAASQKFLECSEEYYYTKSVKEPNAGYEDIFRQFRCLLASKEIRMFADADEWNCWNRIGDPVLHIELRKWAHVLLLCPASANTLAKVANGISDSLMLSVIRAWDFSKPCLFCPAMNTIMWDHPITKVHVDTLSSWGWSLVAPVIKLLACKDSGNGALAEVDSIIAAVEERLINTEASNTLTINNNSISGISNINFNFDECSVRNIADPSNNRRKQYVFLSLAISAILFFSSLSPSSK